MELTPQAAQEVDVGTELVLAAALRVRAHDEAARRLRQLANGATQPVTLGLVPDAA